MRSPKPDPLHVECWAEWSRIHLYLAPGNPLQTLNLKPQGEASTLFHTPCRGSGPALL